MDPLQIGKSAIGNAPALVPAGPLARLQDVQLLIALSPQVHTDDSEIGAPWDAAAWPVQPVVDTRERWTEGWSDEQHRAGRQ